MELHPGQRIGRYKVSRSLGRGGGGEVWEATLFGPQGFRRLVALKLLRGGGDSERIRRLGHEARVGALVSHPNVVTTYDLGLADGRWFVAMELVRGPSLASRVGAPQPPAFVLDVGIQVATALAHVHELGVVHRDVKPGNLLLDPSGLVKLADLGIARLQTEPGEPEGTPGYAPREQLAGREDARADLFALGATLFLLATGRHAFGRARAAEIAAGRGDRRVTDPGFAAGVDAHVPGLGPVVARCLREDPGERPASARELLDELRRIGAPVPVALRPAPAPRIHADADTVWAPPDGTTDPALLGRDEDLAAVRRLLALPGLVTIVGPGGMGKTRLARAVERREHGSLFVELSEARGVDGVLAALAGALGLELRGGAPEDALGRALEARGEALVVLDNLEQVKEDAARLLERWLAGAPRARLLATSRVPLEVAGERVHTLAGLSEDDGVALFVARSTATLGDADLAIVRELVPRLDGMPLAIELAAARTRALPVAAIRDRLADRFRLLAGSGRGRPERHHSLRASLDGTWEVLGETERDSLCRLAVFRGGFELEAAEGVLPCGPDDPWPLDRLDRLAEFGLLVRRDTRFHLLVAVAEYARERTATADRERYAASHARWFARWARGRSQVASELENLVEATRYAVTIRDASLVPPLATAAFYAVWSRGPARAAGELVELALPVAEPADRARLRVLVARIAMSTLPPERARALLDEVRADPLTDPNERAALEAWHARRAGDGARSNVRFAEAARGFVEAGDHDRAAAIRNDHALTLLVDGDLDLAVQALADVPLASRPLRRRLALWREILQSVGGPDPEHALRELVELSRAAEEPAAVHSWLRVLSVAYALTGRSEQAVAPLREAIALARRLGHTIWHAEAAYNLASVLIAMDQLDEADERVREAEQAYRAAGHERDARHCGVHTCRLLLARGRPDLAVRLAREIVADNYPGGPWRGIALGSLAEMLLAQGEHLAEAAERFDEALTFPTWVRARFLLGSCEVRYRLGERATAWAALERVGRVNDPNLTGYHLGLSALRAHDEGRPSEASARRTEARALRPRLNFEGRRVLDWVEAQLA